MSLPKYKEELVMRTEKEQQQREQELAKLRNAEIGTIEGMSCSECEGLEEHKKLENGVWKCLWCGAEVIKL